MENKDKDIIDELLKDYGKQKESHESNFGEIEQNPLTENNLPQNESDEKAAKKAKRKKEKPKKQRKPINKEKVKKVLKAIGITAAGIAVLIGLVFAIIAIVNSAKTAYLKPYKAKYPDVNFPVGIEERFCDYYGENPDTVGYLKIGDANISQYIHSENNGADPVIDKNNSQTDIDFNTVIYLTGKNDLEKVYANGDNYVNATQQIAYSTLYKDYNFNVIGAYYTNSNPKDDNGYCFPYNLTQSLTGKSLDAFTDRLYHRFLYNDDYYLSNNVIHSNSKLITICTKTNFMPDFYFVVVGILDGEKVNFGTANDNVHYPQIWYDKNKKQNSYRFASKWYPEIYINDEETSLQSANDFTKF